MQHFRRRNTNSLFAFHLFVGFAQLLLSHDPSSLRSTLKTCLLPSESDCMACRPCHCPPILRKRSGCILCVIENHQAHHTKYFIFVWTPYASSEGNRSRLRSQHADAERVSISRSRFVQRTRPHRSPRGHRPKGRSDKRLSWRGVVKQVGECISMVNWLTVNRF